MNVFVTLVLLASTIVVMSKCLVLVAHLSPRRWFGSKWKLLGLALGYALMSGGTVGTLFSWPPGAALMVVGLATTYIFDRRS